MSAASRQAAQGAHDRSINVEQLLLRVEPTIFRSIIAQCLAGALSPQVALMQMACESESVPAVRSAVAETAAVVRSTPGAWSAAEGERSQALVRAFADNEIGLQRIVDMLRSGVDSSAPAATVDEGIAFCERLFDWSVQQSEESSVAMYSLGNPEVLTRATDELISQLDAWGTLGPDRTVLQIGCGIGRFEQALGDRVKAAYGIDVSAEMVRAAQRRCAELPNVNLQKCSGRDLAMFEHGQFDLVYAVDTFPYLVQSGPALVARHFAEVHRVLKPQGDFVIFNFSYRGDLDTDRADVRRLASEHGFVLHEEGVQMLELWDGAAWRMTRPVSVPAP